MLSDMTIPKIMARIIETRRIQLVSNSFILRVYEVLTRDRWAVVFSGERKLGEGQTHAVGDDQGTRITIPTVADIVADFPHGIKLAKRSR
jgi:hypothetical protein